MSTKYRVSKKQKYSRAEQHAYWIGVGIGLSKNPNGSKIISKYSDKKKSSVAAGIHKGFNK